MDEFRNPFKIMIIDDSKTTRRAAKALFNRTRGHLEGSDHYLTKLFSKDELPEAISEHCATTLQLAD